MHPAASLLLFTTLSGAGFGLVAMQGLTLAPTRGWEGFAMFALSFGLATVGLASSTFHLGRPERALKAFREWRSSWLSREAWLAAATLALFGGFAILSLAGLSALWLGLPATAVAVATVTATAMIYAQLRTVPRWHHWSTPVLFLLHAATAGLLLAGQREAGAVALAVTGIAQFLAWRTGDARVAGEASSRETATGLGHMGRVRPFEPPHTGDSYLTREMVFVVARKHRLRLRSIALAAAYLAPLAWLAIPGGALTILLSAITHLGGTLVVRWLFFAEAEHVLRHYYR